MIRSAPVVLTSVLMTSTASAHGLGAGTSHDLEWSFEPWILLSLGIAAVGYGLGLRRLRQDTGQARIIAPSQSAAFWSGLVILAIALISPLDALADDLFSAHMVQHLLLLLAAPPLLVYSRPAIVFLWAFPLRTRKRVGAVWTRLQLGRGVGMLLHPIVVWALFSGIFTFWHLPGPYEWALRHQPIHILEHVTFFVSALMFWTVVIEPSGRRRLGFGGSLVFVGSTAILSGLPGALMILAPRPLYAAQAAGEWGLTQLQDQQLAGLVMWVPAGFVYVAALAWLFMKWMQDGERRALKHAARFAAMLLLALVIPALLSACDETDSTLAQSANFGGNPERGAAVIRQTGCGGCHIIPGISGANGLVGPPLTHMARRVYVAGVMRNTPDNLMLWLMNPQQVVPNNAMPDMGLSRKQSRDVAAYLYTLQ